MKQLHTFQSTGVPGILTNSGRDTQDTTTQTSAGSHVGFEYRGRLPSYAKVMLHTGGVGTVECFGISKKKVSIHRPKCLLPDMKLHILSL